MYVYTRRPSLFSSSQCPIGKTYRLRRSVHNIIVSRVIVLVVFFALLLFEKFLQLFFVVIFRCEILM